MLTGDLNGGSVECEVNHDANDLPGAEHIQPAVDSFVAPGQLHGEIIDVEYDHDVNGIGKLAKAVVADSSAIQVRSATEITLEKKFTSPRINNVTNVCEVTVKANIPSTINPKPDLKWYANGELKRTAGTTFLHSARYYPTWYNFYQLKFVETWPNYPLAAKTEY